MTIEITVAGKKFDSFETANSWLAIHTSATVLHFKAQTEDFATVLGIVKPGKSLDKADICRRLGVASETALVQYLINKKAMAATNVVRNGGTHD